MHAEMLDSISVRQ